MIWKKLGLVWGVDTDLMPGCTHAMAPTPFRLNEETIRVYVSVLDSEGRGQARYVDVAAADPTRVLKVSSQVVMERGAPGCFDDNGVMLLSLTRVPDGRLYGYYAGFELCHRIRYRIFTGLAVSEDGGETFTRHSAVPVLDRTQTELFFRGGSFVTYDCGRFRAWYVAGSEWTDLGDGKPMPVYDLRYTESHDGIHWPAEGTLSLALTEADEHGFGRPWIVQRGPQDYHLFYSIRKRSKAAYRLGYAVSTNGIDWTRKDAEMGLDVSPGQFDGNAIMYSAVLDVDGRVYCFYNGDDFGKAGFAVAELV